jgi:hypothetical protein
MASSSNSVKTPINVGLVEAFTQNTINSQIDGAPNNVDHVVVTVIFPDYWENNYQNKIIEDLIFQMAEQYNPLEITWHRDFSGDHFWELVPNDQLVMKHLNFASGFRFTYNL